MPKYMVKRIEAGKWDGQAAREAEADTAQDAAEIICGQKLVEGTNPGSILVEVWEQSSPGKIKTFGIAHGSAQRADTATYHWR